MSAFTWTKCYDEYWQESCTWVTNILKLTFMSIIHLYWQRLYYQCLRKKTRICHHFAKSSKTAYMHQSNKHMTLPQCQFIWTTMNYVFYTDWMKRYYFVLENGNWVITFILTTVINSWIVTFHIMYVKREKSHKKLLDMCNMTCLVVWTIW